MAAELLVRTEFFFFMSLLGARATGGLFAVVCWDIRLRVKGANRFHKLSHKDSEARLSDVGVKKWDADAKLCHSG